MKNKTLAIIAYITLIGWLISFFQNKDKAEKSPLVQFHLEQSLGLIIFSLALGVVLGIIMRIIPALGTILSLVGLIPLIFMVLGIVAANNEVRKPIPLIGHLFVNKFAFLSK